MKKICLLLLVSLICVSCGPKYEPISIDGSVENVKKETEARGEQGEKRTVVRTETEGEEDLNRQEGTFADQVGENEKASDFESIGTETESEVEPETEQSIAASVATGDDFFQQCGMEKEEAESGRLGFIEDVMNDNKEAVAARIVYPRVVTVSAGSFEVQDAAGFLTYYDEIFTESFKTKLDQEAEQELFCSDGMISFGTGMIWFFPSSNGSGLEISTVNGLDGCSVRYGGQ